MRKMNIQVGISDFEKIRKNGYYYVDKSGLIAELLREESTEVTLITRPRRFGKTLGMNMPTKSTARVGVTWSYTIV